MSATARNRKCFTSTQRVTTQGPGFGWEGRIKMLKGLALQVRDADLRTSLMNSRGDERSDDWSEQRANAPRSVRNNNEVPATRAINDDSGAKTVTSSGIAAPTPKLPADANAA